MKKKIFVIILSIIMITPTLVFAAFGSNEFKETYKYPYINLSELAEKGVPKKRLISRLYDEANLFSTEDDKALTEKLNTISEKYSFDFAVATVSDSSGYDDEVAFSDDFYDYNGFGYKNEDGKEGVIMIICMNPRFVYISSSGTVAETVFSYENAQSIIDCFYSDLKNANYSECAYSFADEASYYLDAYLNGDYEEFIDDIQSNSDYYENKYVSKFRPNSFSLQNILIALAIGIILSAITVKAMKNKLISVRKQSDASAYESNFVLNESTETFLYRNITKTPIPKDDNNNSHSGGSHIGSSGSHIGSSGSSHSGGGRSF